MALLVFLRGMNVGGHRTLRPTAIARELDAYDIVNVGAAGTFVVRKPGRRGRFIADLRRKLPANTIVASCDSTELAALVGGEPFRSERPRLGLVPFVSVLSSMPRSRVRLPMSVPSNRGWFVRVLGSRNQLVFGVYRRHMKTIGYLDRIDELFGAPATTRSGRTMLSVLRVVSGRPSA
ncbi:MAG: hypothetical protein AB7N65_07510 [Vicinamibacterales bacterium]